MKTAEQTVCIELAYASPNILATALSWDWAAIDAPSEKFGWLCELFLYPGEPHVTEDGDMFGHVDGCAFVARVQEPIGGWLDSVVNLRKLPALRDIWLREQLFIAGGVVLESQLQSKILKQLRSIDGLKVVKYPGHASGEAGTPDILGCYQGRSFALECKVEARKPTKIQDVRLKEWEEAGAKVGVAREGFDFNEWWAQN